MLLRYRKYWATACHHLDRLDHVGTTRNQKGIGHRLLLPVPRAKLLTWQLRADASPA
jgi:hypothetical protein